MVFKEQDLLRMQSLTWSKSFLFTNSVLSGLANWRAKKVKSPPTWEGVKSGLSTIIYTTRQTL